MSSMNILQSHKGERERGHHSNTIFSSLTKHVWNLHFAVSPGNSLVSQGTMPQGYTPLHCTILFLFSCSVSFNEAHQICTSALFTVQRLRQKKLCWLPFNA